MIFFTSFIKNKQITYFLSYYKKQKKIFFSGVECQETASGPQCGSCPSGYLGDGQRCQNLCEARRPCGDRRCSPTSSSPYYQCEECPKGYEWNGELHAFSRVTS